MPKVSNSKLLVHAIVNTLLKELIEQAPQYLSVLIDGPTGRLVGIFKVSGSKANLCVFSYCVGVFLMMFLGESYKTSKTVSMVGIPSQTNLLGY